MSKIKTGIAVFIVLLVLVVIYVFIHLPMYREPEVGGLIIEFKDGTTEPEVKAILENCNMTVNYTIDYNTTKFKYTVYSLGYLNIIECNKSIHYDTYIKRRNNKI